MKSKVKLYVEECCDFIRLDIKLHKFFQGKGNYLEDAEMHIKNAETAIELDMLPTYQGIKIIQENK